MENKIKSEIFRTRIKDIGKKSIFNFSVTVHSFQKKLIIFHEVKKYLFQNFLKTNMKKLIIQ